MPREARRRGRSVRKLAELLEYSLHRLEQCPFEPKPRCRNCRVRCYRDDYRRRIRQVMRYSGLHFILRGRIDWLIEYFLPSARQKSGLKSG